MLLLMGVSLYTSRVVLAALGVEDYGIYNVVGGVVAMFTMISSTLSAAISRFITFELGKGNQERLNTIFSTSVIIQLIIGVIIAILVETGGVWFLENKIVIPAERLVAARWVLQFSLITLIINLISISYNATIIAHERMSAFAYISIIEASGKLGIAFLIKVSPIDSLIFYAILMAAVALLVRYVYSLYSRRHFEEAKFRWVFDKKLLKEMFGFAGWNFIGTSSMLLRDQGVNILLNLFGGPAVNAARGISMQVTAVTQFSANFMTALNPQITKSYANNNREYLMQLLFQGARVSFYMLLILSLPIILNTNYILSLWLVEVPEYTVLFVQWALVFGMSQALQQTLITAILATGNLRNVQLLVGFIQVMNLPISYVMLSSGMSPVSVMWVAVGLSIGCLLARIYMLRKMIGLSIGLFLRRVVVNIAAVSMVAVIIPYLFSVRFTSSFSSFVLVSIMAGVCSLISIYFVGCNRSERQFVKKKLKHLNKKKNNYLQ